MHLPPLSTGVAAAALLDSADPDVIYSMVGGVEVLSFKAHFHDREDANQETDDNDPFIKFNKKTSTWNPLSGKFSALDHYIDCCRRIVASRNYRRCTTITNLSQDEKQALRELRRRSDIVVKPADKGGAVVVWSRDLYNQ